MNKASFPSSFTIARSNVTSRLIRILLFTLTICACSQALAQDDEPDEPSLDISNSFDFKTIDGVVGRMQPLGDDLMGDMIDVKTGSLTLAHTDISIPGNSNLEVALRRTLEQGDIRHSASQQAFGDWDLDLPIAYFSYGYNLNSNHPEFNNGCMTALNLTINETHITNYQGASAWVSPYIHTGGWSLKIPGKSMSGFQSDSLSNLSDPKSDWVAGGQGTDYAGRCAQIAIAPDGTKYKFGRHTFRVAPELALPAYYYNSPYNYGFAWLELSKRYAVLLITEVEDIHGNWVRYVYNDNDELETIHSKDEREINIQYSNTSTPRNSRAISSISAHSRTWNYNYTNGILTKVTLPDTRYWEFGLENPANPMRAMRIPLYRHWNCNPINWTFSIKHPDGAEGSFTLRETGHVKNVFAYENSTINANSLVFSIGDNRTVVTESEIDWGLCFGGYKNLGQEPSDDENYTFSAMSLVEKTISASNIPEAKWSFLYRTDSATVSANEAQSLGITWTTIIEPQGTKKTHVYHTFGSNHGLLKRLDVSDSSGVVESFEYEYDLSQDVHPNCRVAGEDEEHVGACYNYVKRPQTKIARVRDGATYTTEKVYDKSAGVFVDKGRPNRITKYSTLQSGSRITDIDYWHNTSANIIGLPEYISRNGKEITRNYYNAKGQKTRVDWMENKRETYAYHSDGNISSITDGLLHTATLASYHRGIPRTITRRDRTTTLTRTVDDHGLVTSETNGNGHTTSYEYNNAGWMTRINRPDSWSDTTITYSGLGTSNFYRTILRRTKKTDEYFDAMLRPWKVKESATYGGGVTSYLMTEYDEMGRVISKSLPSTSSTSYPKIRTSYDGLGRVKQVTEYFGSYVTTRNDYLSGNEVRTTDPLGNQTTTKRSGYGSPNDGQVTLIESPEGVNTSMTHDIYGKMLTLTQSGYASTGQGYKTSTQYLTYDNRFNLCRHRIPETGSKVFKYDNNNQVIQYAEGVSGTGGCLTSLPSSTRITQAYDNIGRLTSINYPDSTPDVSLLYDANGNVTRNTRGGIVWDYEYDSLDNLTEEELKVDGRTYTAQYGYHPMGQMSSYRSPSGRYMNYITNGLGQQTGFYSAAYRKTYASGAIYHPNGALKSFKYGNGLSYYQLLNDRQLPSVVGSYYSYSRFVDLHYGYDKNGQTTSISNGAVSGENRTMTYDGLGRLKTANGPWGSGSFEYDALGNILEKHLGSRTVSMNYNSLNRLSSFRDSGNGNSLRTVLYDARGNVTNNNQYSSSGIGFTYDLANQPVTLSKTSSGNFAYDGNYKRVKQTIDGKTIYSFYSQSGKLLYRDNPASSTDKSDYFTINNVTALRVKGPVSSSTEEYLHPDLLGSAVAATNSSRTLQWRESHTPFGEKRIDPSQNRDDIGYTGHVEDSTGLTYMQARYYDPVIGRFYSNDPVGAVEHLGTSNGMHGFNRYAYANNNPYKYTDPTGMSSNCLNPGTTCYDYTDIDDEKGVDKTNNLEVTQTNTNNNSGYNVNLLEHELHGGHTIKLHVAKTISFMRARVQKDPSVSTSSSFQSLSQATSLINMALNKNSSSINEFMSRPGENWITIKATFNKSTGVSIIQGSRGSTEVYNVFILLTQPATTKEGFRIHTSFPN